MLTVRLRSRYAWIMARHTKSRNDAVPLGFGTMVNAAEDPMMTWTKTRSLPLQHSRRSVAGVLGVLLATGLATSAAGKGKHPGDHGAYPDCKKNADCPVGERCYVKKKKRGSIGECRLKDHHHMSS